MKARAKRIKVLVVDDEIGIRELLSEILIDEGYAVITAADAAEADKLRRRDNPEIILLDIWMPDRDGIALLRQWADAGYAKVPVIVMSGHATIDTAVEAVKLGALEVLEKPITTTRLLGAMEKARARKHKQDTNLNLRQTDFGDSPAMRQFKTALLAAAEEPGLITLVGGINSGATFYARFLARPHCPVVVIDNGTALESDLGKIIQRAADGVIIVQLASVLNVIQQNGLLGLIREANKSDARLVIVTPEKPDILAKQDEFSPTLVALLSRRWVAVPPLIKCRPDLPKLIRLIAAHLVTGTEMQKKHLATQAIDELAGHYYQEDFAELTSVIRSIFLYATADRIEAGTVRAMLKQMTSPSVIRTMFEDIRDMSLKDAREVFEREYFTRLISLTNGNMQQAAKISGLDRTYFYRKLKQYRNVGHEEE